MVTNLTHFEFSKNTKFKISMKFMKFKIYFVFLFIHRPSHILGKKGISWQLVAQYVQNKEVTDLGSKNIKMTLF